MNSSEQLNKEETEKAKDDLRFFNEGDYITREMSHSANILEKYINQLETNNQKLIEKLEKDIINITKTLQDGKHCDDYSRCRLKAYRTKTKEILEILKGEKK